MKILSIILGLILPVTVLARADNPELAVKNYYGIPVLFEQILSKHTEDEKIRKEFKSSLNNILAGEQLDSWSQFIDETSTRSSFYSAVFSGMSSISPLKILKIDVNGNKAKANIKLETIKSYAGSQNLPSVEYLFEKYDIKNIKLDELKINEKNILVPELITYEVTSVVIDALELIRVNKLWKVHKVSKKTINSKLKVIMP